MPVHVTTSKARSILTRTTGYLKTISSHSLQPYVGCTFGRSLCGAGCYVQHNRFLTKGRKWGTFLVAKTNAALLYSKDYDKERRWSHQQGKSFGIFMSSSTDPFLPHEQRFGISGAVLEAMLEQPPDVLIIQTHTHLVTKYRALLSRLNRICALRVHISIESDRDKIPGLPPPASSVDKRLNAARAFKQAGIHTVITIAPLLPIMDPRTFFERIKSCANSMVIDHFIGGDGTTGGTRTLKTTLPSAIRSINPAALSIDYRDHMTELANQIMPGKVGVGMDGFAGRLLSSSAQ